MSHDIGKHFRKYDIFASDKNSEWYSSYLDNLKKSDFPK